MKLRVGKKRIVVADPFLKFLDHSALKDTATEEDAANYATEVLEHKLRGTCFRPHHTAIANKYFLHTGHKNSSVLVFPTVKCPNCLMEMIHNRKKAHIYPGSTLMDARKRLIDIALKGGANELDMIIDLEAALRKDYEAVRKDVEGVRNYAKDVTLKVIECAPYFDDQRLADITKAVVDGGADYVKTTTGFGPRPASLRDVYIFGLVLNEMKAHDVGIKAAGGIKTIEQAAAFYNFSQMFGKRPFIIGESSYNLHQDPLKLDGKEGSY